MAAAHQFTEYLAENPVKLKFGMACAVSFIINETKQDTMKAKSIVAIEVSMALTGIAMIGLMLASSYM